MFHALFAIKKRMRNLPRRRSLRPLVEMLENRTVPAALQATSGAWRIEVDPASSMGMQTWEVNRNGGALDHMFQEWFWYRVGSTSGELPINSLTANSLTASGNRIDLSFGTEQSNDPLHVEVGYTLSSLGTSFSQIDETVTLTNLDSVPRDVHFFMYTDLDLDNTVGDDTATFQSATAFTQRSSQGNITVADVLVTSGPAPSHYQFASYPNLEGLLNDTVATNLNDSPTQIGPNDATHAWQWDITNLESGASVTLHIIKRVHQDVTLPIEQLPDGGFHFVVPIAPTIPWPYDPVVSTGYDYEINSGPNFASVTLPVGFTDNQYTLFVDTDQSTPGIQESVGIPLTGGELFDFTTYVDAVGVNAFRIRGIETEAQVNPDDPAGFITELSFVNSAAVDFTMTPLTQDSDTIAPTVSIVAPTNHTYTSNTQPSLIADAADNPGGSGLASVQFQYSGDGGAAWLDAGAPQTSAPFTFTFSSPLADGVYQVRAIATDNAGNSATSAPVAYPLTTLITFDGVNGANAYGGLAIDSSGNLYGTTLAGGAYGKGTVFKIAAGTNLLTTIASFNGTNGSSPYGTLLVDADGNLYGTTRDGGTNNVGTVFEIASGSSTITTLASINDINDAFPFAGLVRDANGNLFGVTGGGSGTVFKVAAGSGVITRLVRFNGTNGSTPAGDLVLDSAGNLFGTTAWGGANNKGTIFKISADGVFSTIVTFDGANGANPVGGLILDGDGNLLGTTFGGGPNDAGTIFRVTPDGILTTLATFYNGNGGGPTGRLVMDAYGNLFGSTYVGGYGYGTLFELKAGANAVTPLFYFQGINGGYPNGVAPHAGMVIDRAGNLYGTTVGDANTPSLGTVFKLTATAVTFTVDTTGPTVSITSLTNSGVVDTNRPTISGPAGTALGDGNLVTIYIYSGNTVNGHPLEVESLIGFVDNGIFSTIAGQLADGVYTAQATQLDAAGNIGYSEPVTFTIAAAPFALTAPADQDDFWPGETASVALGSFTAPNAFDGPWTVQVDWGDSELGQFTATTIGSLGTQDHVYAAAGLYTVSVQLVNASNLPSNSISFKVLVGAVVTTTNNRDFGSLRRAIELANSHSGADMISFAIPADDAGHFYYRDDHTSGKVSLANVARTTAASDADIADIDPDYAFSWWTITVGSSRDAITGDLIPDLNSDTGQADPLPYITDAAIIDGYSQGAGTQQAARPNDLLHDNNAVLRIELNGGRGGPAPVTGDGLRIVTDNSTIRGLVINGFLQPVVRAAGVFIAGGGGNRVQGNFIGTDISGTLAPYGLPDYNSLFVSYADLHVGVAIEETTGFLTNFIGTDSDGSSDLAERNILSAAGGGVALYGPGVASINALPATLGLNNVVAGNFIGTDRHGTRPLGNWVGISLLRSAHDDLIGSDLDGINDAVEGNLVSGNLYGIGPGSSGDTLTSYRTAIVGNTIGPDATGGPLVGSIQKHGVSSTLGSQVDRIENNHIAYHTSAGVTIAQITGTARPLRISVRKNSIHDNGGLGIDLGGDYPSGPDGPTANDFLDADAGPNNFQNFPDIATVERNAAGNVTISYAVDSTTDNSAYPLIVDFYLADAHGQGKVYLGSSLHTAPGTLITTRTVPGIAVGDKIVATATDAAGNTSEFSPMVNVEQAHSAIPGIFAVAADYGKQSKPLVRVFDSQTGAFKFEFYAYEPSFKYGVRVAVGDLNGDGTPDIATASGRGRAPEIRVFSGVDGTQLDMLTIAAANTYGLKFKYGVNLAIGDVDGDGKNDIVLAPDRGHAQVKVFKNSGAAGFTLFRSFDAFADHRSYAGGGTVAVADTDGNSETHTGQIIVSSGSGMPGLIRIFDVTVASTAYAPSREIKDPNPKLRGGWNLTSGDVNDDGILDFIVAAGQGGSSWIRVYDGKTDQLLKSFQAFTGGSSKSAVHATARDLNNDGIAEIYAVQGQGGTNNYAVRRFRALTGELVDVVFANDPEFSGGGLHIG